MSPQQRWDTVAVVIPVFRAPYLEETLESVFSQTHPADDVILVDDGSPDREVLGYTTINFSLADPALVRQWGTGVVKRAQGLGLGKLLKLSMLQRILDELPAARYIDTNNAHSNAAMIGINTEMGFREYHISHCYQLPVEALRAHLAGA